MLESNVKFLDSSVEYPVLEGKRILVIEDSNYAKLLAEFLLSNNARADIKILNRSGGALFGQVKSLLEKHDYDGVIIHVSSLAMKNLLEKITDFCSSILVIGSRDTTTSHLLLSDVAEKYPNIKIVSKSDVSYPEGVVKNLTEML